MGYVDIPFSSLVYSYGIAFILIALMAYQRIPVTRRAVIAVVRMTVQLLAASVALKYIFEINTPVIVAFVYLFMLGFATYTAGKNTKVKVKGVYLTVGMGIFTSATVIIFISVFFVIHPEPWYSAQYIIPVGGMIVGNSMNSSALAFERFVSELRNNVNTVENSLAFGATPFEAVLPYIKKGVGAAITPTVTMMMGIGIVTIPGMMSGQMLSGISPAVAYKYQIVINLGMLSSLAINTSIVLLKGYKLFFSKRDQLINVTGR